jgi:hypothetical protein
VRRCAVFYLLGVVLSGLVMIKLADAVTNLYAFNCLGAESVVLRNKRVELASKKSEFAEIGMKAALAAATYPKFDRFCDGTIEAEDIARAFASVEVEGMSWEVAYMIAKNILGDADTEPSLDGEVPGLNYIEFMTCLEGDAINFDSFLKDQRQMFDEHMLKDEARDAKAGIKKKGKEPSAKEKMAAAKAAAKKKKEERDEKLKQATEKLKADAAAAGMDMDDFVRDREDKDDDAMRERCKKAYEEAKAEIEKIKPAEDPTRKKRPPAGSAPAEEAASAPGEEAAGSAPAEAAAPEPGPSLELSEEQQEERLGKSGKLKLTLSSASGLKAADKGGTSDPFVEAKLGKKGKPKRSKVCAKTLNPSWDEVIELPTKLALRSISKHGLHLTVVDEDKGMLDANDALGKVSADLAVLATSGSISFRETIEGGGGVLVFKVEWEEGEPVAEKADKKKKEKKDETPRADAALEADDGAEKKETTQTL